MAVPEFNPSRLRLPPLYHRAKVWILWEDPSGTMMMTLCARGRFSARYQPQAVNAVPAISAPQMSTIHLKMLYFLHIIAIIA